MLRLHLPRGLPIVEWSDADTFGAPSKLRSKSSPRPINAGTPRIVFLEGLPSPYPQIGKRKDAKEEDPPTLRMKSTSLM